MHELGLCRELLVLVEQALAHQKYENILNVNVEIGPFANIEQSALEFGFMAAKDNTFANNAQLVIHNVDAYGYCPVCQCQKKMTERFESCNVCDYYPLQLVKGHEMCLKSVEVR